MIIGNVRNNWDKGCFIARLKRTEVDDYGNEINYFHKPEFFEFNVQPTSSKFDIALFGEKVTKMYKALIPFDEFKNYFNEGDVAYLEETKPEKETKETYGHTANYKVVSVRPQNTAITIYFEKL